MTAPQPGILYTGMYLKGNYNPGVPGGPSVFDTLAFPPDAGVNAQDLAEAATSALGVVDPPANVTKNLQANFDPIKDAHDEAQVLKAPM